MSSEVTRKRFFLVLLTLSVLLVAALIRPLANALLLAAVLAGVLWPVQRRLTRWLRGRRQLAACILIGATLLSLVGPITGFVAFAVDEAVTGVAFVNQTLRNQGLDGLVERAPMPMQKLLRDGLETARKHASDDLRKTIQERANQGASRLAAALGGALAATWSIVFDTTMMLIALFFLLVQGRELVAWLDRVLPLRPGQTQELLQEFKQTSYAVVVSTAVTAAVQALAALIGYLIARVPHPIFFAGLTFFGALIPAIGAAGLALLAAGILLLTGHPYFALFLAIWAVTVVALVDNVVKPILLRGGMNMPGAVVFFALIGGLGAFGPIGLVLGPLTVAFFVALLRMYQHEHDPKLVMTDAESNTAAQNAVRLSTPDQGRRETS
jgi:predicted PurR-regulated permease PerM